MTLRGSGKVTFSSMPSSSRTLRAPRACRRAITSWTSTSGADAPAVTPMRLAARYTVDIEIVRAVDEDVVFPLPRPLRGEAAE